VVEWERRKFTLTLASLTLASADRQPILRGPDAIDTRHAGLNAYVVEDACRGIDAGGSLAKAWSDMAKAGVKKIQSSDLAV